MNSNKTYTYRYDPEGYKFPVNDVPEDLAKKILEKGAIKNRTRIWRAWQKQGLPLPDPQTGRTGIFRQAVQNYYGMTPQQRRELRVW